jgi:hypothetical protein
MVFRVGPENNNEGIRSIAWTLECPGCFAYGQNADEALASLPQAIRDYSSGIGRAGSHPLHPKIAVSTPSLLLGVL